MLMASQRGRQVEARFGKADEATRVSSVPLVAVLRQMSSVLRLLTDDQYTAKPVGVVDSSVGGHVRHCLDHVGAFLDALGTGRLDYDQRERGTCIEVSRAAALERVELLQCELLIKVFIPADQPLRLSALLSPHDPPAAVQTTAGRELAFLLSHTIHHQALLAAMVRILGVQPPADFGYAPSTIAYQAGQSCAQ